MQNQFPPEHMDRWSRNERLYQHLLGMGLVVTPIRIDSDPAKIAYIFVAADLPTAAETADAAQRAAETGIGAMIERTQIADVIGAAERRGSGVVVELPTVRR